MGLLKFLQNIRYMPIIAMAIATSASAMSPSASNNNLIHEPGAGQVRSEIDSTYVPVPNFLNEVSLTQTQRDQILPILVDLAPLIQALQNDIRLRRASMTTLAAGSVFNEEMARQTASEMGRSMAYLELLLARAEYQILGKLTEEQRLKIGGLRRDKGAASGENASKPEQTSALMRAE